MKFNFPLSNWHFIGLPCESSAVLYSLSWFLHPDLFQGWLNIPSNVSCPSNTQRAPEFYGSFEAFKVAKVYCFCRIPFPYRLQKHNGILGLAERYHSSLQWAKIFVGFLMFSGLVKKDSWWHCYSKETFAHPIVFSFQKQTR